VVRYFWAAPATALGFALVALAAPFGVRCLIVDGVIEAHGPALRWALQNLTWVRGGVSAITFGHLVLGTDRDALARTRRHERVHVAQYERWGPFFIPAYLLASLWMLLRGRHPYFDNPFEREAFRV
jgi:hypothetical protein